MSGRMIAAAVILVSASITSSPANAKPHSSSRHAHQNHAHHAVAHRSARHARHLRSLSRRAIARTTPMEMSYGSSSPIAGIMASYMGTNPTHRRRAWCGEFMGMAARAAGHQPPAGYALARNWSRAGYDAGGPAPGVVMVLPHHVGVVLAVLGGGRVLVRSGNHGRRVGDGVYAVRRAIAWRLLS